MLVSLLPLLPPGAIEVSEYLAIRIDKDWVEFFNAGGPIGACPANDRPAILANAAQAVLGKLAGIAAIAAALSIHRATLSRAVKKYEAGGVSGLIEKRRGPKGPHRLTPELAERATRLLEQGGSVNSTAHAIGMSESGLRSAIERGQILKPELKKAMPTEDPRQPEDSAVTIEVCDSSIGPRERAELDQACENGVAVKRTAERGLARAGKLGEATPVFEPVESVAGAGVLIALPALLDQGLLEVGEDVYGALRNGFFGLRSVLLTFVFMALLRIKTPEQLTEHAPGELGLLLGLDRAPEVKTLRRKLRELGERCLAHTFAAAFTKRWIEAEPDEIGLLYVDGHVRPYHGRTHTLPKLHSQQRGRPVPGTKDFYVNDRRADPLLFVTAEATEGMLSILDSKLLPELRAYVGPDRRLTIAFDREGWSPRLFARWKTEGFDIITYRKGEQTKWQERFFEPVETEINDRKVTYMLAERTVSLANGLRVREIRRLSQDGHQTAVITTNEELPMLEVALRMFGRWQQENFFRYMRQEFALDHLCTHEVEPADPSRMVPSPERAALHKKLAAARTSLAKLVETAAMLESGDTVRIDGREHYGFQVRQKICRQKTEIGQLRAAAAALPKKVRLDSVLEPGRIVQLERERKVLVDAIKLTAYRAESAIARLVPPFFARHEDEARKFLKTIFQATADLLPDKEKRVMIVRFHGLASPRATRALAQLCEQVSATNVVYPGTDLRLKFEAPTSHH